MVIVQLYVWCPFFVVTHHHHVCCTLLLASSWKKYNLHLFTYCLPKTQKRPEKKKRKKKH